jgi:hypothetical protein
MPHPYLYRAEALATLRLELGMADAIRRHDSAGVLKNAPRGYPTAPRLV